MAAEQSRLARRAGLLGAVEAPQKDGVGAIVMPFHAELAALCTRYHRTCSRVLWDLYESTATRLEPLYEGLVHQIGQDQRGLFPQHFSLSVEVRGDEHFAAGPRQIVGTVKNALVDGLAKLGINAWVDPESPQVYVVVRVQPGFLTVSLDLAGRPMNQRGYRSPGAVAPLRENLAAMLVMLARHASRDEVLVDLMAGSGTIAIEAACLAQGRPIWTQGYVPAGAALPLLRDLFLTDAAPMFADTRACILANELDADQYARLVANVERANVADQVTTVAGDFRLLTFERVAELCQQRGLPSNRGLILCNPPYGERLAVADLMDLYRDLGIQCRTFAGFRVGLLVANPEFERAFGGQPRIKKPLNNGPLRAQFLLYDA